MSAANLADLATSYWERSLADAPSTATLLGDHRFSDRLERLDLDSLADRRAWLLQVADAAISIQVQGLDDRLTRDLLVHEARDEVAMQDLRILTGALDPFLGLHSNMMQVAAQTSVDDVDRAWQLLERYRQVPRLFAEVAAHNRDRVADGLTPAAINVERSIGQVTGYLDSDMDSDPFVGITVPDEIAVQWRDAMQTLVQDVVRPAYADHLAFLRDEMLGEGRDNDHPGLCHLPGGERMYATLTAHHTTTDLDPEQIHKIGVVNAQQELPEEWLQVGAAAGLPATSLDELFDHLRTEPSLRYESGTQMVDHARRVVARAWESIDGWFNARPKAPCNVLEVPASLAAAMPPAYYYPPAEDGSRPGNYFLNTHGATERARFNYEAVAFHEAIPGHHFDRTLAQELTDVPTFRRYAGSTAMIEGWGLYTERLADEMGLYTSDLDRLGMLAAEAWRAGRLVVDTGIHAMGWSRQQAIDWFRRWTPLPDSVIAQEVDRYIGMPGQACAYKIGQRAIFELRDRAQRDLGDDFDIAAFHDAVLVKGGLTLPLLETSVATQLGL